MKMSVNDMHTISIHTPSGTAQYQAASGERLLDVGLRCGLNLPYECATGTCGQCRATITDGTYDDLWPEAPAASKIKRNRGEALLCQTSACSALTVSLPTGSEAYLAAERCPSPRAGLILSLRTLTDDVMEITVTPETPMQFLPGQFVLVAAPYIPGFRAYSMVNFERSAGTLVFVIKKKPIGRLSDWLFSEAREGMPVSLFGPLGKATFEPDTMHDVVCIAGGSGIAGMMSIVRSIHANTGSDERRTEVYFGVRAAKDVFYAAELNGLAEHAEGRLHVTIALSEGEIPASLRASNPAIHFATGMVHDVANQSISSALNAPTAFLAGPPIAVDAAIRMLMSRKFSLNNIRFDRFG